MWRLLAPVITVHEACGPARIGSIRQHRRVPVSQAAPRRLARAVIAARLTTLPASVPAAATETVDPADLWLHISAPAPGYGVAVTALTTDGRGLELVLETGLDGVTRVVDPSRNASAA